MRRLTLIVVLWLPVRAGLLMALYLHRVLRSDPDRPLHAMNHFFSPWMLLLLLIVPVLLAWRFVRGEGPTFVKDTPATNSRRLAAASSQRTRMEDENRSKPRRWALKCPALRLHPSSFILLPPSHCCRLDRTGCRPVYGGDLLVPRRRRKDGRVMVVERHSKWEPTTKPYDTNWFVEPELFPDVNSGYNYARIYRYLGQYYEMSRLLEKDKIDDDTLAKCDVLIIKTPTERYSPEEAAAVTRFVEQGGGLLLIGDHTNYERSSTAMNDIIRPMGFIFRDDLLFSFGDSPYEQLYVPPAVPHPAVQHVPPMDFAVSCSIDPGHSRGRPVIANTGLWSMGPEYHYDNFHPIPNHCPEMRYGAFVQTWAARLRKRPRRRLRRLDDLLELLRRPAGQVGGDARHGRMAQPCRTRGSIRGRGCSCSGSCRWRPDVWMAMPNVVEPRSLAGAAGGRHVRLGARFAGGRRGPSLGHADAGTLPAREMRGHRSHHFDRAALERPNTQGGGEGYGLFEQWLARLDCHTVRKEGPEAFCGDVLVVICPSRPVSEEFRRQIEQYVDGGGKLLVIDSPENTDSTANSLLWPFGMSIHHDRARKGKLTTAVKLPPVDVEQGLRGRRRAAGGETRHSTPSPPSPATARDRSWPSVSARYGTIRGWAKPGCSKPDATVETPL